MGCRVRCRTWPSADQKRFTDAVYGGKDQALKEAKAWRDAIVAECPSLDKRERREILSSINTSGVAGVHKWTVKGKTYWRAPTKVGPRVISRVFSIQLYGHDRAFELAVEERERQLDRIDRVDREPIGLPEARGVTRWSSDLMLQ